MGELIVEVLNTARKCKIYESKIKGSKGSSAPGIWHKKFSKKVQDGMGPLVTFCS